MNHSEPRVSLLPLYVGGAFALATILGFVKFRFDRLEELALAPREVSVAAVEAQPAATRQKEAPPGVAYQDVYVPIDVHANHRAGEKLVLEPTLVLRNTSKDSPLFIRAVELYGQDGRRLQRMTKEPFELAPFASREFLASSLPQESSVPSHFIVSWGAKERVPAPLIEAVMVDADGRLLYSRVGRDLPLVPSELPKVVKRPPEQERPRVPRTVPRPVASDPAYELIRYDSNMGLVAKNP